MSPKKLRLLAECLERGFMTDEDRHGWVNDLRGMAKNMERAAADAAPASVCVVSAARIVTPDPGGPAPVRKLLDRPDF